MHLPAFLPQHPICATSQPRSHCDAGWLLTDEGYFDYDWPAMPPQHQGSGGSVRRILDSVTAALAADPAKRFVWAETIWLAKWWPLQNATTRATFRQLVAAGQIEFVGGGWVQNDETMVTFDDVIDQTTTGHEFLRRQFNATVKHGWQIDMFSGYSSSTPSLWALAGYEAMLLRYEGNLTMRTQWEADRHFEFVWRASSSLPEAQSEIFAHVVDGNYGDLLGATGADWECPYDVPWCPQGNPPINTSNVAARAHILHDFLAARAAHMRGPLLMLFGSDFHWHHASAMFGNMTMLMDYIHAHPTEFGGMTLRYSTYVHATLCSMSSLGLHLRLCLYAAAGLQFS